MIWKKRLQKNDVIYVSQGFNIPVQATLLSLLSLLSPHLAPSGVSQYHSGTLVEGTM